MKYGILGGTFDPPHIDHLAIAKKALVDLELDAVFFVPARQNPLKKQKPLLMAKDRAALVKLMLENEPRLSYSNVEITRDGPSYMVETIEEMQMVQPGKYWLILGADSAQTLPKWHRVDDLIQACRIAAFDRTPYEAETIKARLPKEIGSKIDILELKTPDTSSSQIREEIKRGLDPDRWLTPEVAERIKELNLYSEE
jgi:nicotinate-nucleotide adenylyltransferase